jgi:hypothetical protein
MEEKRRPFEAQGKQAAALQNGRHGDYVPPEFFEERRKCGTVI